MTTTDIDGKIIKLNGLGLLDTMTAIWLGFKNKVEVILFLLALGGMLGVLARVKALDAGIQQLVKRLKGKEILIIPLLMIIFGLGGTTYGMWEETIAFFPVVIPVYVAVGYGAFSGVMTILLGAGVGTMASTVNPFAVGLAADSIGRNGHHHRLFSQGTMMGTRWLTWVLCMALAISFVMWIALKSKNKRFNLIGIDQTKISDKFVSNEQVLFTVRRKWALILFSAGIFLMVLAYLPWQSMLGFNDQQFADWSQRPDKYLFWLARSSMWEGGWGHWYFVAIGGAFTLLTIVIFLINNRDFADHTATKEQTFVKTFVAGGKDMLGVALLIAVASGLGVILSVSKIGLLIANSSQSLKAMGLIGFAVVIFFLSLLLSFFVPSTSGFAQAFIPIFAAIARNIFGSHQIQAAYGLIIMGFILASGLINLISPTSAALMAYTRYCEIPYAFWFKKTVPFVGVMTGVSVVIVVSFASLARLGIIF